MHNLAFLFYEFFFTGLFAVGGGLATIPFLQQIGHRRGWYSQQQLATMIAVAETSPGPLGTNMAAFVGHHVAGIPGAAFAAFALIVPTIGIDLIIAVLMDRFEQSVVMEQVMRVLRPVSAGLICAAALALLQISIAYADASWNLREIAAWPGYFDWRAVLLFCVLLPLLLWKKTKKIHPAAYIAVGAVVGIVLGL